MLTGGQILSWSALPTGDYMKVVNTGWKDYDQINSTHVLQRSQWSGFKFFSRESNLCH